MHLLVFVLAGIVTFSIGLLFRLCTFSLLASSCLGQTALSLIESKEENAMARTGACT